MAFDPMVFAIKDGDTTKLNSLDRDDLIRGLNALVRGGINTADAFVCVVYKRAYCPNIGHKYKAAIRKRIAELA